MPALQLEIVTPDRVVLSTSAGYVSLPGVEGEFGVLPGHIPFFAALGVGTLHYEADGKTAYVCTGGGFAEIANNRVQLLLDSAENASEVDVPRAEAALKRAQERLAAAREKQDANINVQRAENAMRRALMRLRTASLA